MKSRTSSVVNDSWVNSLRTSSPAPSSARSSRSRREHSRSLHDLATKTSERLLSFQAPTTTSLLSSRPSSPTISEAGSRRSRSRSRSMSRSRSRSPSLLFSASRMVRSDSLQSMFGDLDIVSEEGENGAETGTARLRPPWRSTSPYPSSSPSPSHARSPSRASSRPRKEPPAVETKGWEDVYTSIANTQTQIAVLNDFRALRKPPDADVEKVSRLLSALDRSGVSIDAVEESTMLARAHGQQQHHDTQKELFCWQLLHEDHVADEDTVGDDVASIGEVKMAIARYMDSSWEPKFKKPSSNFDPARHLSKKEMKTSRWRRDSQYTLKADKLNATDRLQRIQDWKSYSNEVGLARRRSHFNKCRSLLLQ